MTAVRATAKEIDIAGTRILCLDLMEIIRSKEYCNRPKDVAQLPTSREVLRRRELGLAPLASSVDAGLERKKGQQARDKQREREELVRQRLRKQQNTTDEDRMPDDDGPSS